MLLRAPVYRRTLLCQLVYANPACGVWAALGRPSTALPTRATFPASRFATMAAAQQDATAPATALITSDAPLPTDIDAWLQAVVFVDKPQGWTSFDVCAKIRSVVKIEKVGHAGTLDPMATGLLVICIGRATKQVDTLMAQHKEYTGTMRLGQATPSQDADTEVCEEAPWEHVTDADLAAAATAFVGEIQQVPPMYSAIRVGGTRLYEAARAGVEVERSARSVTVTELELTRDAACPRDVHFRVACSKGTYVRTLAHDLGLHLGSRAHLTALRRTQNGEQHVERAWALGPLLDALSALELPERRTSRKGGGRRGGDRRQKKKLRQDVNALHEPRQE